MQSIAQAFGVMFVVCSYIMAIITGMVLKDPKAKAPTFSAIIGLIFLLVLSIAGEWLTRH